MEKQAIAIPDGYDVTESGIVFSLTSNWRGFGERIMQAHPNSHGYLRVRLTVDGKRKSYFVHKLVAAKYLEPRPSPAHEVRHRDGDCLHNAADNLEWGTRKDNAADRERHGRTSRGERHSAAVKRSNQAEGTRAFRRAQREARNG